MKNQSLYPEKGYVTRRNWIYQRIKIPKGHVKCKVCKGSGEIRVYYGPPGDRGQFRDCINCGGLGYVNQEVLEADKRLNADFALSRFGKAFDIIFPNSNNSRKMKK